MTSTHMFTDIQSIEYLLLSLGVVLISGVNAIFNILN